AEEVPTLENGRWTLLPDGRMEMTWQIRSGARWHDGRQLTADDFTFTAEVGADRDVAIRRDLAYEFVQTVAAPDAQTVVVTWKQPYIQADQLFSAFILPRHLLESAYRQDKANFPQLPYWTTEFVGSGPFRPVEWSGGSYVSLRAFDGYALG